MARATSAAATDESTPPDRPHTTKPAPTRSRISATVVSMNEAIVQSQRRWQTLTRKFLRTSLPCGVRSEEHTSELQSPMYLVCRLLLEKKKSKYNRTWHILYT